MAPKKPHRIAAPTASDTGGKELGQALGAFIKGVNGGRVTGGRGRRSVSNNPSRVDNSHMRVPAPTPVTSRTTSRTGSTLSAYDRVVLGMTDDDVREEASSSTQADRREYLSPPNSIAPERPRAREAIYNPDDRSMTVHFRNGGTYVYYGVTSKDWGALKRNHSFGQTLDRLVIGTYPFQKVASF